MQAPPTPPNSNGGARVALSPPQACTARKPSMWVAVSRRARRLAQAGCAALAAPRWRSAWLKRLDFIMARVAAAAGARYLGLARCQCGSAEGGLTPEAQLLWRHAEPDLARIGDQAALARPWWATLVVGRRPGGSAMTRCWRRWCGPTWALRPGRPACVPPGRLGCAHRVARGLQMFWCYGPDSFVELRSLFRAAGWGRPAPAWWGHAMTSATCSARAGFAGPGDGSGRLHLTWSSADRGCWLGLARAGRQCGAGSLPGTAHAAWRAAPGSGNWRRCVVPMV